MKGMIVGMPVVSVPSLLRKKRRFIDGNDLNHIMPDRSAGEQALTELLYDRYANKSLFGAGLNCKSVVYGSGEENNGDFIEINERLF
ncbi:MAG: hypothetical protein AAF847_16640, partial [Bacteroidota bacterium]